jgi:hypothetical protein
MLMRLRLPVLNRLLERRIGAAAAASRPAHGPQDIVRCVESAIAAGAPLIRPSCLTRGLTLYYFLRRTGLEVALCFGVRWRDEQWRAHCWLEKNGTPFLEGDTVERFVEPIYRLPAPEPEPPDRR